MIIASKANMKKYGNENGYHGVFAYSRITGEEYSANAGDYFNASDDWVMEDTEGNPMYLVINVTTYVDVDDSIEHKANSYAQQYDSSKINIEANKRLD